MLTYNIHRAIGLDREFAPDRIAEVLRHHDADLVLLQEVDHGVPRSDHLTLASHLARQLEYQYRAVGLNVFLKKGKYGNATLSRYPIARQRNIDLTIGHRKRRGAQHTRIQVLDGRHQATLDVFNVHLSLLAGLRRQQVHRLLNTGDFQHITADHPCIIAGDTNDWRGELARRFFEPNGFLCATNCHPGPRALRTYPAFSPTGGLDKIFYRGDLRLLHAGCSRLRVARIASDHLPVVADFDIALREPLARISPSELNTTGLAAPSAAR